MKHFFNVTTIDAVLALAPTFAPVATEPRTLDEASARVLAADVIADGDPSGFDRSTMAGYGVAVASPHSRRDQRNRDHNRIPP